MKLRMFEKGGNGMKNITRVKKILIVLVVLIIAFALVSSTYATTVSNNVEDWVLNMNAGGTGFQDTITSIAGFLIFIIRFATIIVTIIMLIIIGLRYMNGTVEDKTADRKMIIKIVMGAIVMISVSGVVETIFNNLYTG